MHFPSDRCIVVSACHWGLGSNLINSFFTIAVMKSVGPLPIDVYYSHIPSPYQCHNGTLEGLLTPDPSLVKTGTPPKDCRVLDFYQAMVSC